MGVYSIAKPKSIVESFVEQCERMDNIAENVLSYNEASIPVFANNNKYYVESDMLIKLMDTKNYSLVEAVDALCFENNIDKDDMTVVINTENAVDEDSIEEMYEFMQEAWKNNVSVAAKDSKGKKIELTINGQKSVIKVKNIDKQIYKAQKQLDKFKETKAWWDGLTEEERKRSLI